MLSCGQAISPGSRHLALAHSTLPRRAGLRTARGVAAGAVKKSFGSFDELIAGSPLVLVDFYATWCGPCVMMSEALNEVAPKLRGRVQVVKIDTDKYSNLAGRYNIQGLPTLILFKNGVPAKRIDGFLPAPELMKWVEQEL